MNFISFLVYLADVLQSLDVIASLALSLSVLGMGLTVFFWLRLRDPNRHSMAKWAEEARGHDRSPSLYRDPGPAPDGKEWKRPVLWKSLKSPTYVAIASAAIVVFTPSANTVYAIAASQAAEKVIASPTVTKAVDVLNRWLDRQAK